MKKILSSGVLIACISLTYAKQDNQSFSSPPTPLVRSITLTPGYMERTFNSNEMMLHGPLGLMQLSTKGFDAAINAVDRTGAKWAVGLGWFFPHVLLGITSNTVYHEFGHARAFASAGGQDYSYRADDSEDNIPTAYGIYIYKILNPLNLGAATSCSVDSYSLSVFPTAFSERILGNNFIPKAVEKLNRWWSNPEAIKEDELSASESNALQSIKREKETSSSSSNPLQANYTSLEEVKEVLRKIEAKEELKNRDKLIIEILNGDLYMYITSMGLNNQMRYAQEVANLIFNNNGHLFYAIDYIVGKITASAYVMFHNYELAKNKVNNSNDITHLLRDYKVRGFNIEGGDLHIGSAASLLLSSTTWSFVYSAFGELPNNGSFIVRPPVWRGWRLPDLNFYLTTQGLSFEVVTGYQFNESWYAGLTAEMVYKGNKAYEVGPSVGYKFNTSWGPIGVSGQVVVSNDMEFGGNVGADWNSANKSWAVGLKYIYHNALTLVGERNIPFLCAGLMNGGEPSTTNHEINMTISYNY